ncbi:hypothetical protein C8F01DRAFT_1155828 [Mycena amicta]|nr:hypothetical protein C8F01DRAFT_1155828 [Mycena amicta]
MCIRMWITSGDGEQRGAAGRWFSGYGWRLFGWGRVFQSTMFSFVAARSVQSSMEFAPQPLPSQATSTSIPISSPQVLCLPYRRRGPVQADLSETDESTAIRGTRVTRDGMGRNSWQPRFFCMCGKRYGVAMSIGANLKQHGSDSSAITYVAAIIMHQCWPRGAVRLSVASRITRCDKLSSILHLPLLNQSYRSTKKAQNSGGEQ